MDEPDKAMLRDIVDILELFSDKAEQRRLWMTTWPPPHGLQSSILEEMEVLFGDHDAIEKIGRLWEELGLSESERDRLVTLLKFIEGYEWPPGQAPDLYEQIFADPLWDERVAASKEASQILRLTSLGWGHADRSGSDSHRDR